MADSVPCHCTNQIGKSHFIELLILLCMVLICFSKADDKLKWKIEKKALQYGSDLRLYCHVENCCTKSAGWGKWTPDDQFQTIFIDVKRLREEKNLKYGGGTDATGFFLIINNVTKEDLNVSYSCTYGFLVSKKKMLLDKNAFIGMSKITTDIDSKPGLNLKIILYFLLAFAAVAVALVVGIIIVTHQRRLQKQNKDEGLQHCEFLYHKPTDCRCRHTHTDKQVADDTFLSADSEPDHNVRTRANISRSNSSGSSDSFESCKSNMN